jgi:DNA-directed RNA polymerase subunit beta
MLKTSPLTHARTPHFCETRGIRPEGTHAVISQELREKQGDSQPGAGRHPGSSTKEKIKLFSNLGVREGVKNSLEYKLETFHRSNQDTCLTHKPVVNEGDWVQSGDLLTDCVNSVGGDLSLGQNIFIAYMPWEGYNFEDAILISERLVTDDVFTSVHIERYEIDNLQKNESRAIEDRASYTDSANITAKLNKTESQNAVLKHKQKRTRSSRDVKSRGRSQPYYEEITRNIPDISEQEVSNLDEFGIVKIGSWVEEGDILVGKVSPINKKEFTPYQKLLYTILDKQMRPFRDSSLRAPKGIKAKVVDIKIFVKPQNLNARKGGGVTRTSILNARELRDFKSTRKTSTRAKLIVRKKLRDRITRALLNRAVGRKTSFYDLSTTTKNRIGFPLKTFKKYPFLQSATSAIYNYGSRKIENNRKVHNLPLRYLHRQAPAREDSHLPRNPRAFLQNARSFFYTKKIRNILNNKNRIEEAPRVSLKHEGSSNVFDITEKTKNKIPQSLGVRKGRHFISEGKLSPRTFLSNTQGAISRPLLRDLSFYLGDNNEAQLLQTPCFKETRVSKQNGISDLTLQGKKESRILRIKDSKKIQKRPRPGRRPYGRRAGGPKKTIFNEYILRSKTKNNRKFSPSHYLSTGRNGLPLAPRDFLSSGLRGLKSIKDIETIHIYLAEKRKIQVGDKMSGRHGNKGIISQILPIQDMPFLPDGTPIDMVLNPLGVPSRMNVGQIYECLLGLAGKYLGEHYRITSFDEIYGSEASRTFVFNKLYEARCKTGFKWLFNPQFPGKVRIFDGRTGECFHQPVTVGQTYMLRLVHMVDDKIHMRSTGPYSLITQQPLRGRSKQGGQRLGEMEVWALEGYGAAFTLLEMLTIKSDDLTGRMTLWSNLILNKDITIGTPEAFKVLICELQALCLDIGLFRYNTNNSPLNFHTSENVQNFDISNQETSTENPRSTRDHFSRGLLEPFQSHRPELSQETSISRKNKSLTEITSLMSFP